MKALLHVEASETGLQDLSSYSRPMASDASRISLLGGFNYYDLKGDSVWAWPAEPEFNLDATFTIEMWAVLFEGDYQAIFTSLQQSSAEKGILFFVGSSNARLVNGGATGNDEQLIPFSTIASEPTHIAWVMDGVNKKLYINGTLVSSSVIVSAPNKTPYKLIFGGNQNFVTNVPYGSSKAKVSQFIFWDDVKYTDNFIPTRAGYKMAEFLDIPSKPIARIIKPNTLGVIAGRTLNKGLPISRQVLLYQRATGELVDKIWSDDGGNYQFNNLVMGHEYYVLAIDYEHEYKAPIQDMLKPIKPTQA